MKKINKRRLYIALGALLNFLTLTGVSIVLITNPDALKGMSASVAAQAQEEIKTKYGFTLNDYYVVEDDIKVNQFLSEILHDYHVPYTMVDALAKTAKDVFPVDKLVAGKDYTILADPTTKTARYFIYEPNVYSYVVYDLSGEQPKAYKVERPVELVEKSISGVINSSLWDALGGGNLSYMLAVKMEEALRCTVDFFHVQKGDKFKLIYTEKIVEGKSVGVAELKAAYVNFGGEETYVYYFKDANGEDGYYDHEGRPMKQAYLKAPVEYARISSPFNMKRFHPILRRVKPHLGTDYAAPQGTPILAIADGVVEAASRGGGNGIFVKLRHDKVYESQYLHMCRHAEGMKPGVHVKQGQIIGYVGMTGLATGPHVCFRFWKNGEQVDFRAEKLPRSLPIEGKQLESFKQVRDQLRVSLDAVPFSEVNDLSVVVVDTVDANP